MTDETPPILFANAQVYTPTLVANGWLLTEGRRIACIGFGRPPDFSDVPNVCRVDANGASLLPGFIDLHVHGAVGHEAMDATKASLIEMARYFAHHGVTSFLPTTWTASPEATLAALDAIAATVGPVEGGATVLGAHLEGPYLNAEKCGAQDPQHIRRAGRDEAREMLDRGVIRLLALAPEFAENLWLIDECVRRGVTVSLAHTAATYAQTLVAIERGATQITHTYNAMTALGHREPGVVGAALTSPRLRGELIADLIHVHPAAIQILVHTKGPEGVILITDAMRATGMPDGAYAIDQRAVTVRDGAVRLADGTLAGSVLTMDRAFRNVLTATGRPLSDLWPLTSRNAARAIGLSATKGSLEVGKDADLTLLDERLEVRMTVAEGRVVYEYDSAVPPPTHATSRIITVEIP